MTAPGPDLGPPAPDGGPSGRDCSACKGYGIACAILGGAAGFNTVLAYPASLAVTVLLAGVAGGLAIACRGEHRPPAVRPPGVRRPLRERVRRNDRPAQPTTPTDTEPEPKPPAPAPERVERTAAQPALFGPPTDPARERVVFAPRGLRPTPERPAGDPTPDARGRHHRPPDGGDARRDPAPAVREHRRRHPRN